MEIICPVCKGRHKIPVNAAQKSGVAPVIITCPDLDRRYRLTGFYLDTRRNILSGGHAALATEAGNLKTSLKNELGEANFDEKLKRWQSIKYPPLGIIEEYPEKLDQIISTYCLGYSYSAATSACCLAERILNRLVIKCRPHFKSHPEYKKIYDKQSFADWDRAITLLGDWQIVPVKAIGLFKELKKLRNESVHYNDGYDFDKHAPTVINKLIELVTEVFGVMNRTDIYLVFEVPGEVWVRSSAQDLPFVKEFVLPHCYFAHAVHEFDLPNKLINERLGRTGKLTDAEFVQLRTGQRSG